MIGSLPPFGPGSRYEIPKELEEFYRKALEEELRRKASEASQDRTAPPSKESPAAELDAVEG